jgi:hypothetical protein
MTASYSGSVNDAQQQILDREMIDPGFRTRLLKNAQQAVHEE